MSRDAVCLGHDRFSAGLDGFFGQEVERNCFDAGVLEVARFVKITACCEDEEAAFVELASESVAEPASGAARDDDSSFGHDV
jgi:hypothetical protein